MTTDNDNDDKKAINTSHTKGREPDYDALQEMGSDDKARLIKIGSMWKSPKSDCLIGETVHGKVILKPRDKKEALEKLRDEKAHNTIQPNHGIDH